jgi:hypothetical protein
VGVAFWDWVITQLPQLGPNGFHRRYCVGIAFLDWVIIHLPSTNTKWFS